MVIVQTVRKVTKMAKQGRGVEQLSVHIQHGPDLLASFILSAEDTTAMIAALDGDASEVDMMFTALMLTFIANIHYIPTDWVLLDCAAVLDRLVDRVRAEMAEGDDPTLPF